MTAAGKALKEDYGWEARSQFHGEPLSGPLSVTIELYFPTKGRQDWDNFHKLSMDALTGIVWEDHSQIVEACVRKGYDKTQPRIETRVQELGA